MGSHSNFGTAERLQDFLKSGQNAQKQLVEQRSEKLNHQCSGQSRSFQGPSKRPSPTKGRTLASFWANSYCQIRHNQTYCKEFLMVHLVPYTDHGPRDLVTRKNLPRSLTNP